MTEAEAEAEIETETERGTGIQTDANTRTYTHAKDRDSYAYTHVHAYNITTMRQYVPLHKCINIYTYIYIHASYIHICIQFSQNWFQ